MVTKMTVIAIVMNMVAVVMVVTVVLLVVRGGEASLLIRPRFVIKQISILFCWVLNGVTFKESKQKSTNIHCKLQSELELVVFVV